LLAARWLRRWMQLEGEQDDAIVRRPVCVQLVPHDDTYCTESQARRSVTAARLGYDRLRRRIVPVASSKSKNR
jgi:hypothetical protein